MVKVIKKGSRKTKLDQVLRDIESAKKQRKGVDAHKYCGIIKLKESPLAIQKKMRNEWE